MTVTVMVVIAMEGGGGGPSDGGGGRHGDHRCSRGGQFGTVQANSNSYSGSFHLLKLCNRCWPMASSRQRRKSLASRWQPLTLQPDQRRTEVVKEWSRYYAASGASRWQSVREVEGAEYGGKERFALSW